MIFVSVNLSCFGQNLDSSIPCHKVKKDKDGYFITLNGKINFTNQTVRFDDTLSTFVIIRKDTAIWVTNGDDYSFLINMRGTPIRGEKYVFLENFEKGSFCAKAQSPDKKQFYVKIEGPRVGTKNYDKISSISCGKFSAQNKDNYYIVDVATGNCLGPYLYAGDGVRLNDTTATWEVQDRKTKKFFHIDQTGKPFYQNRYDSFKNDFVVDDGNFKAKARDGKVNVEIIFDTKNNEILISEKKKK